MRSHDIELQPFFLELSYHDKNIIAEIKPCCQEDNVYYYDVHLNNNYEFTIAPNKTADGPGWRLALANADKQVEPELIKVIGEHIEQHMY
jgi:hypothetical protein